MRIGLLSPLALALLAGFPYRPRPVLTTRATPTGGYRVTATSRAATSRFSALATTAE